MLLLRYPGMSFAAVVTASRALLVVTYTTLPAIFAYLLYKRRDLPFRISLAVLGLYFLSRGACIVLRFSPYQTVYVVLEAASALTGTGMALALLRQIPALLAQPSHESIRRTNEA